MDSHQITRKAPDYQELRIDTIMGSRLLKAPAGVEFDKTAVIVWSRALASQKRMELESAKPRPVQRKVAQYLAERMALAQVLASALGYTGFYWDQLIADFSGLQDRPAPNHDERPAA